MSSTQSPFYGATSVSKLNTPLYLQLFDGTYNAKKTTGALQTAEFEGTKAVGAYTVTADLAADKHFFFYTPSNSYCFYTGTKPTLTQDADGQFVYLSIGAGGTVTIAAELDLITAAIDNNPISKSEITYVVASPLITLTAVQGGWTAAADDGTTAWAVTPTAGTGSWAKVGVLAADWSLNPEVVEVETSETDMVKLADKYVPTFKLINVDERARTIIEEVFANKTCNFALHDKNSTTKPTVILHDLKLSTLFDPSGDTMSIEIKGTKQYNASVGSLLTYVKFWTFNV